MSRAKNDGLSPEQARTPRAAPREREAAELYAAYQQRLAAFNAVDFDDLIRLPVAVLERDAEARAAWRERIRYLLVDECQDTNAAQYRLLKLLAGERGAFTCVGDDDQSIYAWRGANPENLDKLARDYPDAARDQARTELPLRPAHPARGERADREQPARARQETVERAGRRRAASACSSAATASTRPNASPPACSICANDKARVAGFRGALSRQPPVAAAGKSAALARVPYHLTGALSFLDRAEVKDLLAYLRLLANPDDDAAFLRVVNVPRREIGATTLEKLGELAQSRHLSLLRAAHSDAVSKQLPPRAASSLLASSR